MLVISVRPVSSTTTMTMSRIPTDVYIRSPHTNAGITAYEWCVTPSGVADYHYNHVSLKSYGKDEEALMHQILIIIGG